MLRAENAELRQERDEARGSLDVAYSKGHADERDFSRVAEERLTKERDAALANASDLDEMQADLRKTIAAYREELVAMKQERDAARAELDRLRSGAELMRSRAMPRPAEKPVPTESERLRSILMRAHNAICDGFLGGEWAIYVHQQEGITMAAAKEADEAEETLDLICRELSWARVVPNGEKAWQKIAARHAAARQG